MNDTKTTGSPRHRALRAPARTPCVMVGTTRSQHGGHGQVPRQLPHRGRRRCSGLNGLVAPVRARRTDRAALADRRVSGDRGVLPRYGSGTGGRGRRASRRLSGPTRRHIEFSRPEVAKVDGLRRESDCPGVRPSLRSNRCRCQPVRTSRRPLSSGVNASRRSMCAIGEYSAQTRKISRFQPLPPARLTSRRWSWSAAAARAPQGPGLGWTGATGAVLPWAHGCTVPPTADTNPCGDMRVPWSPLRQTRPACGNGAEVACRLGAAVLHRVPPAARKGVLTLVIV